MIESNFDACANPERVRVADSAEQGSLTVLQEKAFSSKERARCVGPQHCSCHSQQPQAATCRGAKLGSNGSVHSSPPTLPSTSLNIPSSNQPLASYLHGQLTVAAHPRKGLHLSLKSKVAALAVQSLYTKPSWWGTAAYLSQIQKPTLTA